MSEHPIDIKTIPQQPGVYLYKDEKEEIIYVGKAKNLKKRVSSYFLNKYQSPKTSVLVNKIKSAEFIVVDNEVEALLLENRLIKKHSPKYNISLKDGKTYAYLLLTDEEYPRLIMTRKTGKGGTYFGPFTDGYLRNEMQELANTLFKLRTCRTLPKKACLNYHIGLCTAPCIKNVAKEAYQEQTQQALRFLKGDYHVIEQKLKIEMKEASNNLKFEIALQKKRQIEAIHALDEKQKVDTLKRHDQEVFAFQKHEKKMHVVVLSISKGVIGSKKRFEFEYDEGIIESILKAFYQNAQPPHEIIVSEQFWRGEEELQILESYFSKLRGSNVAINHPQKGEKKALIEMARKNLEIDLENPLLIEVQEKLYLPSMPRIIECFDISNLGDESIVAGMVQFVDGKPNKSGYRKFKIQSITKQDDFGAMKKAVHRRYKRQLEEKQDLPQLIIIDGGLGQLGAATSALTELGVIIPTIALAKEEEEIYIPHLPTPLKLEKNGRMMLFIRSIRDAVHGFALGYNRKRRQMKFRKEMMKR